MRSLGLGLSCIVLVAGVAACTDALSSGGDELVEGSESSGGEDGRGDDDSSGGEPGAPDACAPACADRVTQAGIATCHACRCKAAFDDWLPSVDELQCANAEPIVTYTAELEGDEHTLVPTSPSAPECANPSLLTGSCRQQSKLGHLVHGDVSMYWICRDPYLDLDGTVIYEDMAVIGHNARSGATCFWDDVNDVMHDDDAPPLDLLEASEAERARSVDVFTYTDGSSCVTCHDHDPFIYTPYLQSTGWQSIAAEKGPYHVVGLGGQRRPTGVRHLVSPQASACTSCHRIGSESTCSLFVPDALATHKISAYESAVHEAMEPGSPHWSLAYWMPGADPSITDFEQWQDRFAEAREHVLSCCAAPGVDTDECQWSPVPAE